MRSDVREIGVENNINYEIKGKGIPLVLIHGVGLDLAMWKNNVDYLSQNFKVITYDIQGHGKSAHPKGPYSLSQFATQLKDLLEHLGIKKANVLGFSLGGLIAQKFALQYPDMLSSLIVVSAVANRTPEEQKKMLYRVKKTQQDGHHSVIDDSINRWFDDSFQQNYPETVKSFRTRLELNNPESYLASYSVFAKGDVELKDHLKEIECPTLIMTGENDPRSHPAMAKFMGDNIPNSEVVIVPKTRHLLPVESSRQFNNIVESFLNKVSSGK